MARPGAPAMPPPDHGAKGKKGKKSNRTLLLAGGGAAAAVVVFAMMRRGSSSGGSTAADTTTAGTGVQGSYDSTANDVYNSIEDQLTALQSQIAAIDQGATANSGTGSGPTSSPIPSGGSKGKPPAKKPPAKKPPTKPKPKSSPFHWITVTHGETLSGIAASNHESLATLLKDNPTYTTNPKYHHGNSIWAGDKVKVR